MVSNLQLHNGAITGVLSGKPVFCFLRLTHGAALPAGQYVIQGPVQDPIYGPVMVMVRGGGRGAGSSRAMTDGGITVFYKDGEDGVNRSARWLAADDWTQSPSFFVSGAQIPGRSCLVVTHGLSELMAGLQAEGGAVVTVRSPSES
jgi:hypothetical protein